MQLIFYFVARISIPSAGRPKHGPVQHAKNDQGSRIGRLDAVDDQIGQAGDHQLARVGRPAGPALKRECIERFHRRQDAPADRRGGGRVAGGDPGDDAQEVVVRRLGPPDRHGRGPTIRSKAAMTVS